MKHIRLVVQAKLQSLVVDGYLPLVSLNCECPVEFQSGFIDLFYVESYRLEGNQSMVILPKMFRISHDANQMSFQSSTQYLLIRIQNSGHLGTLIL